MTHQPDGLVEMQGYMQAPMHGHNTGLETDMYANDICRTLAIVGAATSEDVIVHLRGMNLGDDFWMYSFKVREMNFLIWKIPGMRAGSEYLATDICIGCILFAPPRSLKLPSPIHHLDTSYYR